MPVSDYFEAILLGIVQGLTEFLPVSSSGHLVIFAELIHQVTGRQVQPDDSARNLQLIVALHLGTLLSILVVYRDELKKLPRQGPLLLAIVAASVPVAVAGFLFKDWVEELARSPLLAGCCLLVTAALLFIGQRYAGRRNALNEVGLGAAFAVGLFQALALLPGVSRSGSTIAGGLLAGLKPNAATTFSFLIAIPAIAGAAGLMLVDVVRLESGRQSVGVLTVGAAVSFVVGYVALKWLVRVVAQGRLHWFAWYCLAVGTATIAWQLVTTSVVR